MSYLVSQVARVGLKCGRLSVGVQMSVPEAFSLSCQIQDQSHLSPTLGCRDVQVTHLSPTGKLNKSTAIPNLYQTVRPPTTTASYSKRFLSLRYESWCGGIGAADVEDGYETHIRGKFVRHTLRLLLSLLRVWWW